MAAGSAFDPPTIGRFSPHECRKWEWRLQARAAVGLVNEIGRPMRRVRVGEISLTTLRASDTEMVAQGFSAAHAVTALEGGPASGEECPVRVGEASQQASRASSGEAGGAGPRARVPCVQSDLEVGPAHRGTWYGGFSNGAEVQPGGAQARDNA